MLARERPPLPNLSSKGGEGKDREGTWVKCLNSTTVGLSRPPLPAWLKQEAEFDVKPIGVFAPRAAGPGTTDGIPGKELAVARMEPGPGIVGVTGRHFFTPEDQRVART